MNDVATGQIVRVRSRQYLVEEVVSKPSPEQDTKVSLSCLEDDALGESLEVLWEREIDAKVVGATSWESIANRGFDNPRLFSAYLHTLRWNCVTSTDAKLFQAPYRAGIEVKAYQSLVVGVESKACLHAKCVVVDKARVLVTSANFTEAAHERNIEAGVLVNDPVTAQALQMQFESLVTRNILCKISGI